MKKEFPGGVHAPGKMHSGKMTGYEKCQSAAMPKSNL
jgi:hypothetical protein